MRYNSYRKTDIPWIDQLPTHWQEKNINNLFDERREKVSDKDYPPLSVTKAGIVPQLKNVAKSSANDNRKKVLIGDFVINSRSDRKGSSGISDYDGSVSLISTVMTPRIGNKLYWHYLFKSNDFIEEFYRNGKGIVADLWTTNYQSMKSILLPVPPKEEQEQISKFLDWKINEIDRLINTKTAKITNLKEIINWYIDKHFGISVKLSINDTNINFVKIKYICDVVTSKSREEQPFIGLENIESFTGRILRSIEELPLNTEGIDVDKGMVIFGKLRPYLAKVYILEDKASCSSEFLVLRPSDSINNNFLKYIMLSPRFIELVDSSTYGTKMPRANTDFITAIYIEQINYGEQVSLADEADKYLNDVRECISKLYEEIEKLKTLKHSLISEVVTGKVDVRNIEIPTYEKVETNIDEDFEDEDAEIEEEV